MTRTLLELTFGLALFLAVMGGVAVSFNSTGGNAPVSYDAPDDWEQPAAYEAASPTVVAVRAFIRCDAPMPNDAVNWVLRISCLEGDGPLSCDLQPASQVENLEFSNPDGSKYYIGVITASVLIRRTAGNTRASYSHTLSRHYAPRELDIESPSSYTLPTILLEAELDGDALDMTWSVSNLEEDDCQIFFKVLDAFEKDDSPSCRSLHI